jgi:hypothetical protein
VKRPRFLKIPCLVPIHKTAIPEQHRTQHSRYARVLRPQLIDFFAQSPSSARNPSKHTWSRGFSQFQQIRRAQRSNEINTLL